MPRILFFLFIAGLLSPLQAQLLKGHVKDSFHSVALADVKIIITDIASGKIDSTVSAENGDWQIEWTTPVNHEKQTPNQFVVYPNFPNPFNPGTMISFQTPEPGHVQVEVYNVIGQLVDKKEALLSNGVHRIGWQSVGSAGVYFYLVRYGSMVLRGKMLQLDDGNGEGLTNFSPGQASSTLQKASAVSQTVMITYEKFKYAPDTLQIALTEGQFIEHALETLHRRCCVMDLHNDILERMYTRSSYHLKDRHTYWQTDIPRMQEGGIDFQFFAVWVDPDAYSAKPFATALAMIDRMTAEVAASQGDLVQAMTLDDAQKAIDQNKMAFMFGVEGGHTIENDLQKLYQLHSRGMRYLTITWNNSTDWAVSCNDSRSNSVGLSEFGKKVIRACDSCGIIIDVSHVGTKTIEDILSVSVNPIVATHSGAAALRNHRRNLTDAQIRAIAARGGVVGVVFYPPFLVSGSTCNISSVIRHIDHLVKIGGIDHVALGSDFDGVSDNLPVGLEDTSKLPDLTDALLDRGYSYADVEKILGGNMLRVIRQVCK